MLSGWLADRPESEHLLVRPASPPNLEGSDGKMGSALDEQTHR